MNDLFLIEDDFRSQDAAVTIRPASDDDAQALERLGELDDQAPGAGPHLVADADGEIVAALSLTDGTTVADPFRKTEATVELLHLRAGQLMTRTRARSSRLRRLAAALAVMVSLASLSAVALAATTTVNVAGKPVAINPTSKKFTIGVTCLGDTTCTGVLDVKTAGKIKPYTSLPAAVAKVGAFPFTVAPGATAQVKGRVYGAALAQATLRGRVYLSITPRAIGGQLAPPKTVLFTYRRA